MASSNSRIKTLTKQVSITGPSDEGNVILITCFNKLLEALKKRDVGSFGDFMASPEVRSYDWDNYNVRITENGSILSRLSEDYRIKLSQKFPLSSKEGPFLSYNEEKIKNFGEVLKQVELNKLGNYKTVLEQETRKILDDKLAENNRARVVSMIIHEFKREFGVRLNEHVCKTSDDAMKYYDELRVSSLRSFKKIKKEKFPEDFANEALEFLTSEMEKFRPGSEEVWKLKGVIEAVKKKHRELLESVREESLDNMHTRFCKAATKDGNPFREGSEWHKKLEEKLEEELDSVFMEVKSSMERAGEPDLEVLEIAPDSSGAKRSSTLFVYGLKEETNESNERVRDQLLKLFEQVTDSTVKIPLMYRVGNREGTGQPRPVEIRFTRESDRNVVLEHRNSFIFRKEGLRILDKLVLTKVKVKARRKNGRESRRPSPSSISGISEDSEVEVELEDADQQKRSNLILYGVNEAIDEDNERLKKYLAELIEVVLNTEEVEFKFAERIGDFQEGAEQRPRPVRIGFNNEADRNWVFEQRNSDILKREGLKLCADLPQERRQNLRALRKEVVRIRKSNLGMAVAVDKERYIILYGDKRKLKIKGGKALQLSNNGSSAAEGTNRSRLKRSLSSTGQCEKRGRK